jgi:hypothetical protein
MIRDKSKYNLDKLPIRDEVKKEIGEKKMSELAAIDLIHTVGRMLSLQDEVNEEQFDTLFKGMCAINKKIDSLTRLIKKLSTAMEETKDEIKNTG